MTDHGDGLHVAPARGTARLVEDDGLLVATGSTEIDDADVAALLDAGRR